MSSTRYSDIYFNPNTLEVGAGRSLWVQGPCGLHTEFQEKQNHIVISYLKNKKFLKNLKDEFSDMVIGIYNHHSGKEETERSLELTGWPA